MRVGRDQDIDAPDAAAPQIRRHDIFAGIDVRLSMPAVLQKASAVDHHDSALRKHDQQAVTLADVDHGKFKRPGAIAGGHGCHRSRANAARTAATAGHLQCRCPVSIAAPISAATKASASHSGGSATRQTRLHRGMECSNLRR